MNEHFHIVLATEIAVAQLALLKAILCEIQHGHLNIGYILLAQNGRCARCDEVPFFRRLECGQIAEFRVGCLGHLCHHQFRHRHVAHDGIERAMPPREDPTARIAFEWYAAAGRQQIHVMGKRPHLLDLNGCELKDDACEMNEKKDLYNIVHYVCIFDAAKSVFAAS